LLLPSATEIDWQIGLGEQWRGVTPERDGFDIRRTGRDVPILASYVGSEI